MYHVLDVCKYIINYSNEMDYGVSCLKLQKLLYFIQGYFMIIKDESCFHEKIEAWDFGPVVPLAYQEYKHYASTDIPSVGSQNNSISDENKILIDNVINKFADYTATDLVTITHQQKPWKSVYSQYQINEITIDSLKSYFSK